MCLSTFQTALLSLSLPLALSQPTLPPQYPKTIHQFPNPTWLENIFTTRHGHILTGMLGHPELYLLDPSSSTSNTTLQPIATFPDAGNSVFGITEYDQDIFAVIVGEYDVATSTPTKGSWSIWGIDLTETKTKTEENTTAQPFEIATLPTTPLANGLTTLNPSTLLVADSGSGLVVAVCVETGESKVVIDDASMKFDAELADIPIGINGLKMSGGYLYYSNSYTNAIYRVAVNSTTGEAVGDVETVVEGVGLPDDFAVAEDGTVFVARPLGNTVERVEVGGKVTTVVGGAEDRFVMGATSVTLGRGWWDRGVGYVSTNGGLTGAVGGEAEGGKVAAFRLDGSSC